MQAGHSLILRQRLGRTDALDARCDMLWTITEYDLAKQHVSKTAFRTGLPREPVRANSSRNSVEPLYLADCLLFFTNSWSTSAFPNLMDYGIGHAECESTFGDLDGHAKHARHPVNFDYTTFLHRRAASNPNATATSAMLPGSGTSPVVA